MNKSEIYKHSEKTYIDFLRAYINGDFDHFFPLNIKFSRPRRSDNREEQKQKIENLIISSKSKLGYGYEISWKQAVSTRDKGNITYPDSVHFINVVDYLSFINKTLDFDEFQKISSYIISKNPLLKTWILENPENLTNQKDNWSDLIKVCNYFLYIHQPASNLYIRELPIDIHTKFIENNKYILNSLLTSILPQEKICNNYTSIKKNNFEKRFYLNYNKTLIRYRILDENMYLNGLSDISILPEEFFELNINCENVFIVENLMNVLTFPKAEKSIIIWGKGNRVSIIKHAKWLNRKKIYYWGDIDSWGFHILSTLREHFRDVNSILMSKSLYEKYHNFAVKEKLSNIRIPQNLTIEETETFVYLSSLPNESNRLEQEHIPIIEISKVLNMMNI